MHTSRTLGKTELAMPPVGVGLWAVGGDQWGTTDDSEALRMLDVAVERGVQFYDTADVYGDGHSEQLLGRSMQGRRDRFIVASKIGWQGFDGENGRSAYDTVEKLIAGVERNLQRLQTDYIDIMQSHINFREPNMEVFVEGFERLQQQGKIRAYGVSTSDYSYLQEFNHQGGCATLQIDYSILNRTSEADCLPYARENSIGVIVRGALAMGILTGKFAADSSFQDNDFRQAWITDPDQNRIFQQDLAVVGQLRDVLELGPDGQTLAQLALRFVLDHPAISMVIPGGKNARQLEQNLSVLEMPPLSDAERDAINAIVPPKGGRKIWPA
ncbi:aldo/keto reductase [Spirochaeta africana]|uniref:Putative oxidoreductase, aryl-alcohol dehydrogenase like protein n=1 Tax=Spirochaeta africana (strain ATCC 700263 / DSM 8902 / Z-7692) TaxID=889378 RepID=H9ULP9_SPIAZ|nr:aldo/keto reductase [Spirochaeta africana]AFG38442.1 putative oxidoreductase, aryl-alcohol dehydrogenase like protein [Spirochaeta africana DSM 8902]